MVDDVTNTTRITITTQNGVVTEVSTGAFLFLYDDEIGDQITVIGELTPGFIQECLIINPIEQFANQYESGEIEHGDGG